MGIQFLRRAKLTNAVFICVLFAACASAPVQEMSDARQAIRAAQNAGAEQIAAAQLQNAQTLLTSAEKSLQKRMYRAARRDAVAARNQAVEAIQAAGGKSGGPPRKQFDSENRQSNAH